MRHDNETLTLALNSAEGVLQLVLGRISSNGGCEMLAETSLAAASRGAELLTPELNKMLREHGVAARDIQRVACVRGPGGFTGIRLGLATALGIAGACGAMLAGLDYLPLLAANAFAVRKKQTAQNKNAAWAILHARRNEVVLQGFNREPTPITPALALSPADAARMMREHGIPLSVFGSGLLRNAREIEEVFPEAAPSFLREDLTRLSPESLLKAASSAVYSLNPIEPLYVRPCDAEQNLPDIAKNMGWNPDEAVRRLADLTRSRV